MACCVLFLLLWQVPPTDLETARRAVEDQEYGLALRLLSPLLEADSTHIEARYLRAIALREQGRNPTLKNRLQRLLSRSGDDFKFVIQLDSTYRDVLFQYALLKWIQNELEQAIQSAEAQLRLRPELEDVFPRLLSFYWRYTLTQKPAEARAWLRQQPGALAPLFIGRAYARQGMYDSAERIYREHEQATWIVALLANARVQFARQRLQEGTQLVQEAINNLQNRVDALVLFEEIKTIVSPEELHAFERIEQIEGYRQFFKVFWRRRDPMPAAPYNARMAEHYRRLQVAEQEYLFTGFRSWFGSPFTYEDSYLPSSYRLSSDYTDRGIVFIRHGEPDDYTAGEANSWLYYDSTLVFHFAPTCLSQVCGITEHLVPVPVGPTFQPALVGLDELDMERRSVAYLVNGLSTDRHQWPAKIQHWDVPYVIGAFRGIEGHTLVEVYYEVPLQETARITGPDSVLIEAGFAVHSRDWNRINYIREQTEYARGAPRFTDRFQVDLPAGKVRVSFHTRVLEGVHLQATQFDFSVPEFSNTGLQLSDLLLADRIEIVLEGAQRDDVILDVNPSGTFSRSAMPVVYFEIYNLERGVDGQTRYRITYTLISSEQPRSQAIGLQTSEQTGVEESTISYVSVDLSEAQKGHYILEVQVEDLITGAVDQTSRSLILE